MSTLTLPECFLDNLAPIITHCRENMITVEDLLDGEFDSVENMDPGFRDNLFYALGIVHAVAQLNDCTRIELLHRAGVFVDAVDTWSYYFAADAASDGWGLFTVGRKPGVELQRDDDAGIFECDDEAALHVANRAVVGAAGEPDNLGAQFALWTLFHVAPREYYRIEALYRVAYNRGLNVIAGTFDAELSEQELLAALA